MQRFAAFALCGTYSHVDKNHQISSIIAYYTDKDYKV